MTKLHEEHLVLPLGELLEQVRAVPPRGELVLVISGAPRQEVPWNDEALLRLLHEAHEQNDSLRGAVDRLSDELALPRRRLYRLALDIWRQEE